MLFVAVSPQISSICAWVYPALANSRISIGSHPPQADVDRQARVVVTTAANNAALQHRNLICFPIFDLLPEDMFSEVIYTRRRQVSRINKSKNMDRKAFRRDVAL